MLATVGVFNTMQNYIKEFSDSDISTTTSSKCLEEIYKKRSLRIRDKYAKGESFQGHLDKQFVYDLGELNTATGDSATDEQYQTGDDTRPRSASWSSKEVAVVERRVRRGSGITPKKGKGRGRKLKGTTPKLPIVRHLDLSQRRIDILFNRKTTSGTDIDADNEGESEDEREVNFKQSTRKQLKELDPYDIDNELRSFNNTRVNILSNKVVSTSSREVQQSQQRDWETKAGGVNWHVNTDVNSVSKQGIKDRGREQLHKDLDSESEEVNWQVVTADQTTSANVSTDDKEAELLLSGYGSDYTSVTGGESGQERGFINQCESVLVNSSTTTMAAENKESSIFDDIPDDEPVNMKHWKLMMGELKKMLKSETKVEVKTQLDAELKSTKTELKICQVQLNEVTGVTIRQDQELRECKREIENLKFRLDRNLLRITGLEEQEGEDCKAAVKAFFTQKLEIQQEIAISDAFRVGKGQNRSILVYLQDPKVKGLIFKNTVKLKDLKNNEDRPYGVSDQLSAKKWAEKQRIRQLQAINKKLDAENQLDMKVEKGTLFVDKVPYVKGVQVPSCRDILNASKKQRIDRLGKKVTAGSSKMVKGQEFIGYTAAIKTIEDANTVYAKVRSIHTDARHVVAAWRIPGRNFHICQDFVDDEEHEAGSFLLNILVDAGIQCRIAIVVRKYEGEHIGELRWKAMFDALKSAFDRAPKNCIIDRYDCLWQHDTATNEDGVSRGRGRGRGGSRPTRRSRFRWQDYSEPPADPEMRKNIGLGEDPEFPPLQSIAAGTSVT